MWFKTSVRFDKMMENGSVKRVTESNLFDALSFTEAESRTIEELTPFISGEFTVSVAKKTKIAEIFNPDGDYFYEVKVAFVTLDEKSGTEKRSVSQILVGASDFDSAYHTFLDGMKGTMADFELLSLTLTDIVNIYPIKTES